jgi:hypothetical protein
MLAKSAVIEYQLEKTQLKAEIPATAGLSKYRNAWQWRFSARKRLKIVIRLSARKLLGNTQPAKAAAAKRRRQRRLASAWQSAGGGMQPENCVFMASMACRNDEAASS